MRCGRSTSGGDGPAAARTHCQRCEGAQYARWSRERVIEVLLAFEGRFGRRPTSYALNPTAARRRGGAALERYEAFRLPSSQVSYVFGSFQHALDEALGHDAPPAEEHGYPQAA